MQWLFFVGFFYISDKNKTKDSEDDNIPWARWIFVLHFMDNQLQLFIASPVVLPLSREVFVKLVIDHTVTQSSLSVSFLHVSSVSCFSQCLPFSVSVSVVCIFLVVFPPVLFLVSSACSYSPLKLSVLLLTHSRTVQAPCVVLISADSCLISTAFDSS